MEKKEQQQKQILANSSDKPMLVFVRKSGVDKRDPELHTVGEILQRF